MRARERDSFVARDTKAWPWSEVIPGHRLPSDLITEKLVRCDPTILIDGYEFCTLCNRWLLHRSDCPWQMAIEYIGENPDGDHRICRT